MIETEPDTIMRVLDTYRVRDSHQIAQSIHSALLRRRLTMLAEKVAHRQREGLV